MRRGIIIIGTVSAIAAVSQSSVCRAARSISHLLFSSAADVTIILNLSTLACPKFTVPLPGLSPWSAPGYFVSRFPNNFRQLYT